MSNIPLSTVALIGAVALFSSCSREAERRAEVAAAVAAVAAAKDAAAAEAEVARRDDPPDTARTEPGDDEHIQGKDIQGKDAQGKKGEGASKQEKQDPVAALFAALKKENIELDREKKQVTIPVEVNRPQNDLEYLLIYPTGKRHEALLITPSKPSLINTALLAIGLEEGKNASYIEKKPVPTRAEIEAGVEPYIFVPPSGQSLYMTVAFTDAGGKKVELAIEDLVLDWTANLTVTDNKWIYLGGRMAQLYRNEPEVYMADYEGNLISVCYRHPHNHLVTLEHERARDEMNWTINRDKCPPAGTEMQLTFHVTKPKVVVEREARMKREAEARAKTGEDVDLSTRPDRNPAREGGFVPPPDPKKDDGKKDEKTGDGKKGDTKKGDTAKE